MEQLLIFQGNEEVEELYIPAKIELNVDCSLHVNYENNTKLRNTFELDLTDT